MKNINNPRIGAHLPISKGLIAVADNAIEKGLESLQIFLRNPRGRGARKLTDEEIEYFKKATSENNISPIVVHIPYICNPASVKDDLYEYAYEVVIEDLKRCEIIGADYLVLHPGSHTSSSFEQGIERVSTLLNRVISEHSTSTKILLELMSGQGTEVGKSFEELKAIIDGINEKDKIGICYDTCHGFAGGYDCKTPESVEKLLDIIDKSVGRASISIIHANDSMKELGSKRDRHAIIGEGFIGLDGFNSLIKNEFFKKLPFILETPYETIYKDVNTLKSIRKNN